jgi:hypothetical protein
MHPNRTGKLSEDHPAARPLRLNRLPFSPGSVIFVNISHRNDGKRTITPYPHLKKGGKSEAPLFKGGWGDLNSAETLEKC